MKREIDIILDNLEELQALVQAMSQEKEIPSILFRFSYDKTTKIVSLLKELETAQLKREEMEEQVDEDVKVVMPVTESCKVEAPAEMIVPVAEPVPAEISEETSPAEEKVAEPAEEIIHAEIAEVDIECVKVNPSAEVAEPVDFGRPDELAIVEESLTEPLQQMDIEMTSHSEILSDSFTGNDPYLSFEPKKTLNEQIQQRFTTDFRKAISLNDRFRFLRELFSNNPQAMDECIEKINHSADFGFLETELINTYKWNKENEDVKEFLNLVRQRFV